MWPTERRVDSSSEMKTNPGENEESIESMDYSESTDGTVEGTVVVFTQKKLLCQLMFKNLR